MAWMKLSVELPINNLNHRWYALLKTVKAKWEIDKWPHDFLNGFAGWSHREHALQALPQAGMARGFREILEHLPKAVTERISKNMPGGPYKKLFLFSLFSFFLTFVVFCCLP